MSDAMPVFLPWQRFPCKIWTGAVNGRGYGHHFVKGSHPPKWALVHREALEQKLGRPILPGYFACHHCDTPTCHEPEHLYEGTQKQNLRDMTNRGRAPRQILSTADREEILRRYAAGGITQRELAAEYGVTRATITTVMCKRPGHVKQPRKVVSEALATEIRLRHAVGERGRDLARIYGMSESAMYRLVKAQSWNFPTQQ